VVERLALSPDGSTLAVAAVRREVDRAGGERGELTRPEVTFRDLETERRKGALQGDFGAVGALTFTLDGASL
jgi:hypothetical protein